MHEQLGDACTRRACGMPKKDFWKLLVLHCLLSPHIERKRNWDPDGVIKKSLAMVRES
jgi:hypothetical protein